MSAVSVVIPSYGRPTTLMLVLQSLAQQKFIDEILFEVLVVLDGSQPSILASLQLPDTPYPLSILTQEHRGPAAARNRGVAAAQGDLILFLDDDVVPAPHWMAEHVAAHRLLERRSVVFGPMLSPQDKVLQPWVAWEQHQLHEKYARLQCGELAANPHQFYTGNASLYRADFLRVGGFDESLWRSEDVELAYRLAATQIAFHFAERAESYHYAERSYENWSSLPYVYGSNSVVLAQEKGHDDYLQTVLVGFATHHPLIKLLLKLCLDRQQISNLVLVGLKYAALASCRLQLDPVGQLVFSAIYNLRRYQGMADQLGGRSVFYAHLGAIRR